jgi:phage protein U
MIGTLGNVVFETSAEKVRTFSNFKRKNSARLATHELLGRKPVVEFIGPGIESISFTIRLDVLLGLNPLQEAKALRDLRDKGEAVELVIGGEPVSENLWVIEDMSEDWDCIDNQGNILVIELDISLKEYVRESTQGGVESAGD